MTKQFEVIPVEDYSVVVDKEANLQNKDLYFSDGSITGVGYWNGQAIQNKNEEWKVIATINKRIDNIPLIEIYSQSDDTAVGLAKKEGVLGGAPLAYFISGYKAAGGYSEEDIKNEINEAFKHGQGNGRMMEAGLERDEQDDYVRSRMIKIKSLQTKLPNNVILEMERVQTGGWWCTDCEKEASLVCQDEHMVRPQYHDILKITDPATNTITPVSYDSN